MKRTKFTMVAFLLLLALASYFAYPILSNFHTTEYPWFIWFLLSDGFILVVFVLRSAPQRRKETFDPSKLSIVIACYNGEHVIGETIRQALMKASCRNIFVVSDASTDNTTSIARRYGVNVFENQHNLNKALSISSVVRHIRTPYTLVLDDDTHIAKIRIPTSLLDRDYAAVAFVVTPKKEDSLVNKLQRFEYRKSMMIYKRLASSRGAVDNVSGAVGLFHTKDLVYQAQRHSGQAGGEDQQRTAFVHLIGRHRHGIVLHESEVTTSAPNTFWKLFRQRAYKWSRSVPENFVLNLRIVFSHRLPALLRVKKAYQMYIFLTDPLRIVLFGIALTKPLLLLLLYMFYLVLNIVSWLRTDAKDPFYVVLLMPIYGLFKSVCRFVAYMHWFVVKYDYTVVKKYHKLVQKRRILFEYALATLVSVLCIVTASAIARIVLL